MNVLSKEWETLLESLCLNARLAVDRRQLNQLAQFSSLLLAWNEKTNLTSITHPAEIAEKHILDSLIPAKLIQTLSSLPQTSLLDIGSGGGFPGIPLKIYIPQLQVTMVESVRKKVNFIKYVIRTLHLEGIFASHSRIEALANQKDYKEQFDVVISRAFAPLQNFLELAAPFIKTAGHIIAMKGNDLKKELAIMESIRIEQDIYNIHNFQFFLCVQHYTLPESGSRRTLVIAKKAESIGSV